MKDYIVRRATEVAKRMLETNKSLRGIALEYPVHHNTIHNDLVKRLPIINPQLAKEVREVLDHHIATRNVVGGQATKEKYKRLREQKSQDGVNL